MSEEYPGIRQERRQEKQMRKRERMIKHGHRLAQTYRDAILKRLKRRGTKK
ncbi:hypothetical protein ACFLXP_04620 [Chloroflexota bacterium]